MSSQSSNLSFQSDMLPTPTVQSDVANMPAAALAQLVDRLSQDHGLSAPSRHKVHLFAVQTNPSVDALWIYALSLSHNEMFEHILGQFGDISQRLTNMTNLVRHEWQLSKSQEDAIKHSQRVFITQSKTSYRDLADRTKEYLFHHSVQFSLPMYVTDKAVATTVNRMIEKDAHQVRGSFRKLIYGAAVGSRRLNDVASKIDSLYSTETGDEPLPVYFKAHIAQLRLIAFDLIQAAGPSPPSEGKRPKHDTGFWNQVDSKFKELTMQHGADYDNSTGWRQWEIDIINQDEARFDGHTQHFSQEIVTYHGAGPHSGATAAAVAQ